MYVPTFIERITLSHIKDFNPCIGYYLIHVLDIMQLINIFS